MSHVSHYMDSYPLYTPKGTWYRFEFAEKQSLYPSFFNESMYVNESLYIHCICASQCIYIASMYMNESLYIHCVWVSQCICIEGIYIHWLTRVCDMTHPHTHAEGSYSHVPWATHMNESGQMYEVMSHVSHLHWLTHIRWIWVSQYQCIWVSQCKCHVCLIYIDSHWVNVNETHVTSSEVNQ